MSRITAPTAACSNTAACERPCAAPILTSAGRPTQPHSSAESWPRSPRRRSARRALITTTAVAAAMIGSPAVALAAGSGSGPGGLTPPHGPVATITTIATPKTPTTAKTVSISAHVSPVHRLGPGTPAESGTVIFTIDGAGGTAVPLAHSHATEKLKLAKGSHTVTAKYSGDQAHSSSESKAVTIMVN